MFLSPFPAALLLLGPLALSRGDGTFIAPLSIPLSQPGAVSIAVGDFDRDGRLSLAMVHGISKITILDPDPVDKDRWTERAPILIGIGDYYIRADDFDRDGDDDLIVADPEVAAYHLRCRGDGTFDDPVTLATPSGVRSVAVGDWNRDGLLDLATTNHPSHLVSVLLCNAAGNFTLLRDLAVGSEHHNHDITSLDFNGDGFLDLMLALDFTGLIPLQGKGDGQFARKPAVVNLEIFPMFVGGFRLDGDGLDDVIVQSREGSDLVSCVGLSDGTGEFRRVQELGKSFFCFPAVVDLSGDGVPDLAVPVKNPSALELYLGKGDGTFEAPLAFASSFLGAAQIVAADLDGDSRADLAVADGMSSSLHVIKGKVASPYLEAAYALQGFDSANGMAIANVDDDSAPDVFISSQTSGVVAFLNPRARAMGAPSFTIPLAWPLSAMAMADMDGDAIPDLLGSSAQGAVLVGFLGDGGKLLESKSLPTALVPGPVSVGRLDAGDTIDLAVPCAGSNEVHVFLNQGGRAFDEVRKVSTCERPRDVALGDLDRDGICDMAVMSQTQLAVHFGLGAGNFTPMVIVVSDVSVKYLDLALIDVDSDGMLDIALSESRNSSIHTYRGQSGRQFQQLDPLKLKFAPSLLSVADLDEDGHTDLVVSTSRNSLFVLRNREGLGFEAPTEYMVGFSGKGLCLSDLQGDGALDIVSLGISSATILMGNSTTSQDVAFRRGDADGNGTTNITDAITVLGRLFLGGSPLYCEDAADSNDDGVVNLTDPIFVLLYLFLGGGALPAPGPADCGLDPTPDDLLECTRECK